MVLNAKGIDGFAISTTFVKSGMVATAEQLAPWLMLAFGLPSKKSSQRVQIRRGIEHIEGLYGSDVDRRITLERTHCNEYSPPKTQP